MGQQVGDPSSLTPGYLKGLTWLWTLRQEKGCFTSHIRGKSGYLDLIKDGSYQMPLVPASTHHTDQVRRKKPGKADQQQSHMWNWLTRTLSNEK